MKTILTILIIFLSFGTFSQTKTPTDTTTSVGNELIKFEKQHSNGVMLTFAGSISLVIGTVVAAPPIGILGGVMLLAGEVIALDSHRHIKNAGLLMNQNNIGTNLKKVE